MGVEKKHLPAVEFGRIDLNSWYIHNYLYHPIFVVIEQEGGTWGFAPRLTSNFIVDGHPNELILGGRAWGGSSSDKWYDNYNGMTLNPYGAIPANFANAMFSFPPFTFNGLAQFGAANSCFGFCGLFINPGLDPRIRNNRMTAMNFEAYFENRLHITPELIFMFGAKLFADGQGACVRCHGGPGWTVSTRFYEPSPLTSIQLPQRTFSAPSAFSAFAAQNPFQTSAQPAAAEVAGFNAAVIGPPQLACALRFVGTFGVPNDTAATDALEVRSAGVSPANRAQGRGGYNVPSLYGLQVGAPYLHHGQAKTLEDLFTDAAWVTHTQAGAANFLTGGTAPQDRADLINFLLSIDTSTVEVPVVTGFDSGCSQ